MKEGQEGDSSLAIKRKNLKLREKKVIEDHLSKYKGKKGPLETEGFLSRSLFGWMSPLFKVMEIMP